ncbi:LysM peptidoglycan-binding domain-containing protein [Sporosarcina sp. HYO08]|uniref:cell division suppressor protein YneA n=1 Tax=Sporosarcina sp. HYO08 TaxID=1759557 RepID=UPI0007964AB7|nr:LysM peptidoglycan-binding domain-containing protein [Sporosarcina sp. HYO08]KXH80064.1 hypothetical protein AU377_11360 [Sporosarcina sp. HYO08]
MAFLKNNSYIILVFIICIVFTMMGVAKYGKEQTYGEIVITEGDTLWGLAVRHADNESKEEWIEKVKQLNDLSSDTIQMGESLLLPTIERAEKQLLDVQLASDDQ